MNTLAATAYDVLIHTIAFLYVPDVRLLRQIVHQRFYALTMLRIVWKNTFKLDIWSPRGIVFTGVDSMEPDSEKSIAVPLDGRITLLHLDDERTLHDIRSIDIKQRSVNDWRCHSPQRRCLPDTDLQLETDERTFLDDVGDSQLNSSIQVIFST
ncbi:uncharacterized protein ARMOST_02987 [Armillaria ostoyae]|uniref:F-box domain-containing protein n=1 Tax=Armillaria ostoyae TaxID=47428 RepID=A0A284QT69_ARMOS|nr:uncharacterized protein ARMOST_02987 [Armillaria ostoyae]